MSEYYGIDSDKPISVYWNLHEHRFSIVQDNKVVRHLLGFGLRDCVLRVQPAGNARVRDEMRKNVHAYIKGMLDSHVGCFVREVGKATYNPYKHESFVMVDTGEPVYEADFIDFSTYQDKGVTKPIITIYQWLTDASRQMWLDMRLTD